MIGVINPNAGNLKSLINALESLNFKTKIIDSFRDFKGLNSIILPGVGAFHESMLNLDKKELTTVLNECVLVKKIPFLGICIGMQVLAKKGHEFFSTDGLGWIDGEVVKINKKNNIRIPHMGWNNVKLKNSSSLFDVDLENTFYFVHSYHLKLNNQDKDNIVTSTVMHGDELISSIEYKNIYGVQFHPEKSQDSGLKILKNFISKTN